MVKIGTGNDPIEMEREVAPIIARVATFALILAFTSIPAVGEDEEVRSRRRKIEVTYAERYMEIAKAAKKQRGEDLMSAAFRRAELLDPGNEDVIDFEPVVTGEPTGSHRRQWKRLSRQLDEVRLSEAKARVELALWLDDEAWPEESAEEARKALTLVSDPISFDEEGVLSTKALGELPKSLSLGVLDEYEVFAGKLVPVGEIPSRIPWKESWTLDTEHFKVMTNVSGRLCRTIGRALEAAREVYKAETGWEVQTLIKVYVIAERSAFEKFWESLGNPRPHPSNTGKCMRDICAVDGSRSTRDVISVTIHEVAHGYFNLGHEALVGKEGAAMPPWFAEGLATYCAGYGAGSLSFDRGVVVPEIAKEPPLRRFQTELSLRMARPLEKFMAMEELDSLFYYQAYAFYWFFREGAGDDLKDLYRRAVKAMIRANLTGENRIEEGNRIFCTTFGGDLTFLQERFFEWVRGLEFPSDE